jgi:hypothetical protein
MEAGSRAHGPDGTFRACWRRPARPGRVAWSRWTAARSTYRR